MLLRDRLPVREALLGLAELVLVGRRLFIGGDDERPLGRLGPDDRRAADPVEPIAEAEPPGDLDGLDLAGAVDEDVGPRVEEDGAADVVAPVVVMGEAPERGLDAAEDDPRPLVELAEAVGVDDDGPVGHPRLERRVGVDGPLPLERGVIDEHAVDRARGDAEEEARPAELDEILFPLPVGALDDADLVALGVEDAGDHPHGRQRVVGVGLAADEDDIESGALRRDHSPILLNQGHNTISPFVGAARIAEKDPPGPAWEKGERVLCPRINHGGWRRARRRRWPGG